MQSPSVLPSLLKSTKATVPRLSHWYIAALLLAVLLLAQTPAAASPLTCRVTLSPQVGKKHVSGRMIVILSSKPAGRSGMYDPQSPDAAFMWLAAQEVRHWEPGSSVDIDADALAFPAPLSQAPAGDYYVMALLDVGHNAAYHFASPGDLYSKVVQLKAFDPAKAPPIELTLTERVPPLEIPGNAGPTLPRNADRLDFVSPVLSKFWGRDIHMRGVVLLPPDYATSEIRYPTVYWTHGFGGNMWSIEHGIAPRYAELLSTGKLPPMIYVLLDESCPTGTHEFADSLNNGPWGTALTKELIPHLEKRYRMMGVSRGRFVTGHSSGGWAALWLGVTYPDMFGGTWPTAPDPSDFRSFIGPNLRARPLQNFYRKADGSPWMLVRIDGKEVESMEQFARQERVLGEYGGQMTSFEWVFSPRGEDGRPQQLFDRDTGAIDPAVEDAWEKYDIAQVIRAHAAFLKPKLQDHIHLYVGTADTFHLDESARLLEQTLKELGIRAQFTFIDGRTHSDLYEGGLTERIAREMEAAAHPAATTRRQP
jgi:S-formylglutathione hydrolase FrmB